MNIMDDVKNQVRDAADIVQIVGECVELKKSGSRYMGRCPFHVEKTPSFTVNPQGGFFHCFGCGESGDVFSFVMKYHRMAFPEALKELARRYHIDLPERRLSEADKTRIKKREQLYRANEKAAAIYRKYLLESDGAAHARTYLEERRVPLEIATRYGLGYAPDPKTGGWDFLTSRLQAAGMAPSVIEEAGLAVKRDRSSGYYDRFRDRVLFPISDMTGNVVAFGGRILGDGKPKYLNSPETPVFDKSRLLFGLYQHKESIRQKRRAIVVEGNFDLLLLVVHGIDNVVAPLGTALTPSHIRLLRGFCDEVILLFDGDSAGLKAAMRSVPFFLDEQVDARVALLPDGADPDSYVRENGADGVEALISRAGSLAEFVFDYYVRQHGLTLEGKNRIIGELNQLVRSGSDSVQRSLMINHFSEKLGISPEDFQSGVRSVERQPPPQEPGPDPVVRNKSLKELSKMQLQIIDFVILYPEYLDELLAGGLEQVAPEPAVLTLLECLKAMTPEQRLAPGHLLSALPGDEERSYVADLLSRIHPEDEHEGKPREMCDELLSWLACQLQLRNGADLQHRIRNAQAAGDLPLVMELLRKHQELVRKKDLSDNLLNK